MRIYRRNAFLALPAGVIYANGPPWAFGSLCVKGETLGRDWACLDPCWIDGDGTNDFGTLDAMLTTGESRPGAQDFGRDGVFDPDSVFLVFERADLRHLAAHIERALLVTPE